MKGAGALHIDGIRLRELVIGAGAPVLLVHGWGASVDLLAPFASRLCQSGYRCHMLDLPGFGESGEPNAPFTIFDYARFCLAYLDHHGLERVHYFGHSLGGRIGLILAADHPDRLAAMALSNSAGLTTAAPLASRLRLGAYKAARRGLESLGAGSAAEQLRRRYNQRYASADYRSASPVMRQTLVNIVSQDLLPQARRVAVPTLLIWGDQDEETPLWMGEALERAIPDAALVTLPGAGHYAYLDQPEDAARIVDALFRAG